MALMGGEQRDQVGGEILMADLLVLRVAAHVRAPARLCQSLDLLADGLASAAVKIRACVQA